MNERFPVLSIVSILFRIAGAIAILAGLYLLIVEGIIEPNLPGHAFGKEDKRQILMGLGNIFSGLIVVAFGEIIGVLFAIEKNTRST